MRLRRMGRSPAQNLVLLLQQFDPPTCLPQFRLLLAGVVRRAGVEGSGNYGAALSRYLLAQGIEVIEAPGPGRSARRRRSKSDQGDAEAAARAVLSGRASSRVKAGNGPVEIARMYDVARDSAVKAYRQATNQIKAVLVTAEPALREELAGLSRRALVHACVSLGDDDAGGDPVLRATRFTLRTLAERIEQLTVQARELERRLAELIERHHPELLAMAGVGPHSAAVLLITMGDNPERLRSEASFAALCGASPVEYSSGSRCHRRLNRGGDRQANAALYRIVLTRLRWDPRTQAYYERRVAEGETRREVIRCLNGMWPGRFTALSESDVRIRVDREGLFWSWSRGGAELRRAG
ncbi:IS110 family transposase [Streptomyces sp. NPDC059929]|uniref:IS110 family transposase n=2 Tax=unclassified Streptomyces TaxID=2593676 RepID=UPI003654F6D3